MNKARKGMAVALMAGLGFAGVGVALPSANAWLHVGIETRKPAEGGTWKYGFENVKVRSYYTVSGCHGSSVKLNGDLVRSINTASNQKSIAEKSAINTPGADDAYYYRTC
ncbi:lactococcin 972 family bacteriocin [Kribbella sp. NPDC056861]|uniref:lactococcin 972 family bacteriocin n=1 Tax=Kribbella sp. NPDC056861 TaxID=3154857 RepID=UPI003449C462